MKPLILRSCLVITVGLMISCASASKAQKKEPPKVTDYKSCIAAGYPMLKSFPPRCAAVGGKIYIDETRRTIGGKMCKDICGDGVCQQIVCQAEGCPCAETPENCAKDCGEGSF